MDAIMPGKEVDNYSAYAGEPSAWYDDKDLIERAKQQVTHTVLDSYSAYREQREKFDTYFAHYANLRLNLPTKYGTQLPTGQAAEITDSYIAEFYSRLCATRPFCPLLPRNFPEDVDATRAIEGLLQYDYDYMRYKLIWYELIKSVCIYGTAVAKVHWRNMVVKTPLAGVRGKDGGAEFVDTIGYRGPWVTPLFIYDVFPDRFKTYVDDDYPMASMYWRSYDHFERLASKGPYDDRAVKRIKAEVPDNLRTIIGGKNYQQDQRAKLGMTSDERKQPDGILTLEWEGRFRFKLDELPKPAVITWANDEVVCVREAPLVTGEHSYIWITMDQIPKQLYGVGVIGKCIPQIHAGNVALNLVLTHVTRTVKGEKVVRPDLLINPSQLQNPPGGFYEAKPRTELTNVIQNLRKDNLGRDVFNLLNYSHGQTSRLAHTPDLKQGRDIKGDTSATEVAQIQSEIAKFFQTPLELIEQTGVIPMTQKMYRLNQQFVDPEMIYLVLDKAGRHFPQRMKAEYLAIDPDFVPQGSKREAARALMLSRLSNHLRMLTPMVQMHPKYAAVIDLLLVRIFEEENFQNLDEVKRILAQGMPQPESVSTASGAGRGAPGIPNSRRETRIPEPKNIAEVVKAISGSMSNAGR